MKKAIAFCLTAAIAFSLLAGCQATPDDPIVVQKDLEQMIEKAQATDTTSETPRNTLAQRLGVPERFTANESYTDGRLTLAADAEIVLPDVDALPTMRVEPENFSQELVDRFYDYLVGDTPMYQQQMKYTREQVQENIVRWQKTLNDPNSSEESKSQAEQEISNLEGLYNSASEEADMIAADSEIKLQTEYDFTTGKKMSEYSGVDIAEEPGLNVQRGKITVEEDEFGASVTDTASQAARFYYYDYDLESDATGITLTAETVTPDSLTDRPEKVSGLSYQEALDMTHDFLNETGIKEMRVDSLTLNCILPDKYQNMMNGTPTEHFDFLDDVADGKYDANVMDAQIEVSLVRVVNGIKVTNGEFSSYIGDAMYGAQWYYEKFTVGVCSDGIYSVTWISPHTITETVTENTNIRPFDEIADVFDKMYRVTYEAQSEGRVLSGKVNKVTLTLRRIMDQNNIGYGLFVPVWDFYGTMTVSWPDSPEDPPQDWLSNEPLITINAIDGTVIDLDKGY